MTQAKRLELDGVLAEYGKVVNHFINIFWDKPVSKMELLRDIVHSSESWFSARLKKVAAREAIDMVSSVRLVQESNKEIMENCITDIKRKINKIPLTNRKSRRKTNNLHIKLKKKQNHLTMLTPHKPIHSGDSMRISSAIADLQEPKESNGFDAWLHLASIGNNIILDIPIKFHKHYRELASKAERCNAYIVTKNYVQFSFERETGPKKDGNNIVGIDSGINALASTSEGKQYGKDIKSFIERSKRCKSGSKGKRRATNALRQRICEVAKEVIKDVDLVVVEKLKGIGRNTKLKGRLSLNTRSSIGSWNYRYWLSRVEMNCEGNRVSFRTVLPYNTSRKCPACNHIDSNNRSGEIFKCQNCGHSDNADINAALNIKDRFLSGPYGAAYKQKILSLSV